MKHLKGKNKRWTQETGYKRRIILPFGSEAYSNIQMQLTEIAAGNKVVRHHHAKQTEFIFFLEGSCDFTFKDITITLESGDLLIIDPNEKHSASNIYDSAARFLTFKINGDANDTIWDDKL